MSLRVANSSTKLKTKEKKIEIELKQCRNKSKLHLIILPILNVCDYTTSPCNHPEPSIQLYWRIEEMILFYREKYTLFY